MSSDSDFWGEGEDSHSSNAFDFGGEGEDDMNAFYSGFGEFEEDEDEYGDFEMDEDVERSGEDSDDSTPLSMTDRLAKQLAMLNGDHDGSKDAQDSTASLFSSFQSASKKAHSPSSSKQDKSQAIRKQLLQYQQQLKIRLFLQQPQGHFEQLPLDPTMFVKLTTLDIDDSGKLNLQDPDSDDEHLADLNSASNARNLVTNTSISLGLTDNEVYAMLSKGSKVRKLDCILNQDYVEQNSFQISSKSVPGTIPFDVNNVADVGLVQQFYKHPLVKKMKLAQAITAQTLGDLIQLERAIAKGSGASVYDESIPDKDANASSNLSSTALLDEAFDNFVQGNLVLRGMTAKQTSDLINTSAQNNKPVLDELDNDTTAEEQLDDNDRANVLLSDYHDHYDNIENYLELLFSTSMDKINKTLDKWDKRTNSSLATSLTGNTDLSSLSIPLSQQITTIMTTEQKRLVQKSRLRRFALNPLCIDPQIKHQLLLALSDLTETAISAQDRFDTDIYDDFDFTANLLQDVNSSLNNFSTTSASNDALSLSFKQLQQQQDAIAKQLKRTTFESQHGVSRHLKKKHVQVNVVVPKAVNFMLPRLDIAWIRANGLDFDNNRSESDTDNSLKDSVDPLLGTSTTDAMFVDNLFLHLFGTQQQRVSKYVEQLQQQLQKQKDTDKDQLKLTSQSQRSDTNGDDDDDDDDDEEFDNSSGDDMNDEITGSEDGDDGDDYEKEFGGSDMGSWFKKK